MLQAVTVLDGIGSIDANACRSRVKERFSIHAMVKA